MNKKRVLFVGAFKKSVAGGATGGVQSACNSLVESELLNFYEFELIDTSNNTVPPPKTYQKIHHIILRNIKSIYFLFFGRVSTLICFSSSGKSLMEKGFLIFIAKLLGKKTIISIRSGDIEQQYNSSNSMKRILSSVLKYSDVIIGQSDYWSRFYSTVNTNNKNKIVTIYNWLNINEAQILKDKNKEFVELLFLGWIEKTKGIYDLIEAVDIIVKNNRNFKFKVNVCGGGAAKDDVIRIIKSKGIFEYFVFHGWVNGVAKEKILNSSDIFVMPTYFEGFPNSMIEAINYRCAVVINNIPTIEGYLDDGKHALISQIGNKILLASHIQKLMESFELREKLANNALVLLKEKNNLSVAVEKFKSIL
ncbi:MAG TPA: glycosyltransferase family 4 protein [Saprospiraceae bacterium]|nr:glycosyltransferase family 4 protein [Saprospiraceae bacterium]HMU02273.1 glycosyltransferase family 4 protein [Saprospiraceae bacterium]